MSSLNTFNIISKSEQTITVEVNIVHPDEHIINASTNFALQIILELYDNMRNGHIYNSDWCRYPFSQTEANERLKKLDTTRLDALLLKMRWRSIALTQKEYEEIQAAGTFEYNGQKLVSLYNEGSNYIGQLETEHDAFCEEAEQHIAKVEVNCVQNFPHWTDSIETWLNYRKLYYGFDNQTYDAHQNMPNPQYILKIQVEDEAQFLLEHIKVGAFWSSAAYDFLGYTKTFSPQKQPIYHVLQYDTETEVSDTAALWAWWESLDTAWKQVLLVNAHLQSTSIFAAIQPAYSGYMTIDRFTDLNGKAVFDEICAQEINAQKLTKISGLKALYANGCKLTDLAPLRMLKGLKILELEANPLQNLDALAELPLLEELILIIYEKPNPSQLSLQHATRLKYLYLDPQNEAEFQMIGQFTELRELTLLYDFEADMRPLLKLQHLQKLTGGNVGLTTENKTVLETLRKNKVNIVWDVEDSQNGNYYRF